MLKKILKGNITIKKEVSDWEESIRIASQPLLIEKKINEGYIESMIKDIKKMGFYVVLADKVAMPHSRPENGVKKTSLALLKLDNPVKYGDNDVNLIFILAAKNKDEHINIIKELSAFLDEDIKIEKAIKSTSINEIEKNF